MCFIKLDLISYPLGCWENPLWFSSVWSLGLFDEFKPHWRLSAVSHLLQIQTIRNARNAAPQEVHVSLLMELLTDYFFWATSQILKEIDVIISGSECLVFLCC